MSLNSYGNFLLQPVTNSNWNHKDYYSQRVEGSDSKCMQIPVPYLFSLCLTASIPTCTIILAASPGYFSTRLARYGGTLVEVTATRRTSLYRITYPDNSQPAVIIDVADDLYNSFQQGKVDVAGASRITGHGKYRPSFGPDDASFTAYFCADFNSNFTKYQIFDINGLAKSSYAVGRGEKISTAQHIYTECNFDKIRLLEGAMLGAVAYFDSTKVSSLNPVMARIGISFISEAQACQNGESEIPDFNFEGVRQAAKQLWNNALSRVIVNDGTTDQRKLFYSSVSYEYWFVK